MDGLHQQHDDDDGKLDPLEQQVRAVGRSQVSAEMGMVVTKMVTRMEVLSVLLSTVIWRVARMNLAGGAQRGMEE